MRKREGKEREDNKNNEEEREISEENGIKILLLFLQYLASIVKNLQYLPLAFRDVTCFEA